LDDKVLEVSNNSNEAEKEDKMQLSATFLYSGMGDFWSGDGDRWDKNKGCLFASYDPDTTLKDLIESWVNDYTSGGDCDDKEVFERVSEDQVRQALIDMLSPEGKEHYENDVIWEGAKEFGDCNPDYDPDDDDFGELPVAIVLLVADCLTCGSEGFIGDPTEICQDCSS
jgi:hypothetical protein